MLENASNLKVSFSSYLLFALFLCEEEHLTFYFNPAFLTGAKPPWASAAF